jgi:anti-sigma B factor antagonist
MSSFSIRGEPDGLVLAIDEPNALNDFRSNDFRDSIFEAVMSHDPKGVALDLGRVDFLSSSGVAILIGLKRRLEGRQGKLVVFAVQPVVRELLRLTRLTQHLDFAADESDALNKLRPVPTA